MPSASVDADPFTATDSGDVVAVNDAVGAWFGVVPVEPTA